MKARRVVREDAPRAPDFGVQSRPDCPILTYGLFPHTLSL